MARKWVPLSPSKDLDPRLVRLFKQINLYMGDQSGSIAAISRGEAPDGSGTPLPVVGLDKYFFLPGRNGGQIGFGGQGAGESLTFASTASATKGSIFFGTTGVFDEVNTRFGLNKLVPTATIHVKQFSTGGNLNFFPVDPSSGSWGVVGPSAAQALADNNDATYIQSGWDTFYAEVVDLPTIPNLGLIPDNTFSVTIRVKLSLAVGNYLNPMTVRVYHGSGGSGNIIATRDLPASLFSDSVFTDYTFTLTPSEGADFKTSGVHSFRFSNVGQTIPNADFNVYRAYLTAPGGASAGSPFVYESSAGINQAFIDYLGSLTANGLTVRDATTITKAVTFDLTSAFSGTQTLKFLSTAARTWTFPDVTATLAYISPLLDGINNSDTLAGNVLLGDLIHGNATPKWARLAGNTDTTKKFLTQTGNGSVSAIPGWNIIVDGDLPTTITGKTITGITSLGIRDTSAAFDTTLAATSSTALTAGRTLTLDMGNVAHTLKFGTTANTITFPSVASDTVVMLAATQTLTSKTLTAPTVTGTSTGMSWTIKGSTSNTPLTIQQRTPGDTSNLLVFKNSSGITVGYVDFGGGISSTFFYIADLNTGENSILGGLNTPATAQNVHNFVYPSLPTENTYIVEFASTSVVNLLAQNTTLTAQTIMTTADRGGAGTTALYRATGSLSCQTAGSAGSKVNLAINWTQGSVAKSKNVVVDMPLTSTATADGFTFPVYADISTAVTYTATFTSGGGTPKYDLHIRLEYVDV